MHEPIAPAYFAELQIYITIDYRDRRRWTKDFDYYNKLKGNY